MAYDNICSKSSIFQRLELCFLKHTQDVNAGRLHIFKDCITLGSDLGGIQYYFSEFISIQAQITELGRETDPFIKLSHPVQGFVVLHRHRENCRNAHLLTVQSLARGKKVVNRVADLVLTATCWP